MVEINKKVLPRAILEGVASSTGARFVQESLGPARSFLLFAANRLTRGKIRPDLNQYFEHPETPFPKELPIEDLSTVLHEIDIKVSGGDEKKPKHFLGKDI